MSDQQKIVELKQSIQSLWARDRALREAAEFVLSDVWRCIEASQIEGTPAEESLNRLRAVLREHEQPGSPNTHRNRKDDDD